jgi:hypothetical protein
MSGAGTMFIGCRPSQRFDFYGDSIAGCSSDDHTESGVLISITTSGGENGELKDHSLVDYLSDTMFRRCTFHRDGYRVLVTDIHFFPSIHLRK